ncbi:soil-associated protein, TIGR03435 family [Terriglobus roseus]|uniref:Soil-associated protein, TIGR03435 family n=2 Tax=Terriglobus roseus TaxID=392734 RepID=A0A1G7MCW9_9BACT|nr:soil-associated protein, TIGR03435 family [Terriglobus roseus]
MYKTAETETSESEEPEVLNRRIALSEQFRFLPETPTMLLKTLLRATVTIALFCTATTRAQQSMPPDAKPGFEVVTVKPAPPDETHQGFDLQGRHVLLKRESVLNIIIFAYSLHPKQVVDAPEWVSTEFFDIDGVPDVEGEPNLVQYQYLLQRLLTDRFGLHMHNAKRDLPDYSLRVIPGGIKFAKTAWTKDNLPHQGGHNGADGQTMTFTNSTMADFLLLGIQHIVDRPVVDETGLTGRYDFALHWLPDQIKAPEGNAAPGLFTAMREQLGLELKATKGPVDVLVVDTVQKPEAD